MVGNPARLMARATANGGHGNGRPTLNRKPDDWLGGINIRSIYPGLRSPFECHDFASDGRWQPRVAGGGTSTLRHLPSVIDSAISHRCSDPFSPPLSPPFRPPSSTIDRLSYPYPCPYPY